MSHIKNYLISLIENKELISFIFVRIVRKKFILKLT